MGRGGLVSVVGQTGSLKGGGGWCRTGIPGRCRTEIWVGKGVALHRGVAATVAGVALHCATKELVELFLSNVVGKLAWFVCLLFCWCPCC